jgi:coatomer subunit beta
LLDLERKKAEPIGSAKNLLENFKAVDELIQIRQLKRGAAAEDDDVEDEEAELGRAVASRSSVGDTHSKLARLHQLTGFSDPVYCEANLTVSDYDIVLDILVLNQTQQTMQNLSVELNTNGDLKVVERPQVFTLAGGAANRIHATVKLSSTEAGIIFGNIVYDNAQGTQKNIVVLNNIHMDIIDYIHPASCTDQQFRAMWQEFEWENKVQVNTEINELNDYLQHILAITNMLCMTPENTMSGECNFLAANLYAKSMFNEDALLNLSVEKQKNGKITGFIRIRSKTQGIALSLGDKITQKQRAVKE